MSTIIGAAPNRDTDYSIWPLAYCQADMPYDFFGRSGMFSNKGSIKTPILYTLLGGGEVGDKQHVALVDCGFGKVEWLQRSAFSGGEHPRDLGEKVGFAPADVEVILVT